jgi:hypothetical protein
MGIFSLLFDKGKQLPGKYLIMPLVGYCFLDLFFWFGFQLFNSIPMALGFSFGFSLIALVLYLFFEYRQGKGWHTWFFSFLPEIKDSYLLLAIVAMFFLSAWPILLEGPGNYYHSGNPDFLAIMQGGHYYFEERSSNVDEYLSSLSVRSRAASMTIWRTLFNIVWIDAFLVQIVLSMLLSVIGIYWLVRNVFNGGHKASALIAFSSMATNFYFTTFLAGHTGSLSLSALLPVFLGLSLLFIRRVISPGWLILNLAIFYFAETTYPQAIYFLLVLLIIMFVHERIMVRFSLWRKTAVFFGIFTDRRERINIRKFKWIRILFAASLGSVLFLTLIYLIWLRLETYRIVTLFRYEAWMVGLYKEIWLHFFGIFPSGLIHTFGVPFYLFYGPGYYLSFLVALMISAFTFVGALKQRHPEERQFLCFFFFSFPLFYAMMRYISISGYYTYKFLYLHQFLIVIVLGLFLADRRYIGNFLLRVMIILLMATVGGINMYWNISKQISVLKLPFNDRENISALLSAIPKNELAESAVDCPDDMLAYVFEELFRTRGIRIKEFVGDAKYLFQIKSKKNMYFNSVTPELVIYENNAFRFIKATPVNNILITGLQVDKADSMFIGWVENSESRIKNKFDVYISDAITAVHKLHLENSTYIDMPDDFRKVFEYEGARHKINFQNNPAQSRWFLRLAIKSVYGEGVQLNRKHVWRNFAFSLEDASLENKAIYKLPPVDPDFEIGLANLTPTARFLRIILSPGPSIDFSPFTLIVSSGMGTIQRRYDISPPNTVLDLPLALFKNGSSNKVILDFKGENLFGKSLMPREERFLNYSVLGVELTDQIDYYSPFFLNVFNNSKDITSTNKIKLGTGWYPFETIGNEKMRWVGKEAELLLDNLSQADRAILLDLEPGPGCGGKPLSLKVFHGNTIIENYQISGRQKVEIKIPEAILESNKQNILKLLAETLNAKIAWDPRILNFRVFSLKIESKNIKSDNKNVI